MRSHCFSINGIFPFKKIFDTSRDCRKMSEQQLVNANSEEGRKRCYFFSSKKNTCWNGDACPYVHTENIRFKKRHWKKLEKAEEEKVPQLKEEEEKENHGSMLVPDYSVSPVMGGPVDWPDKNIHCIYFPTGCAKKDSCPYLHAKPHDYYGQYAPESKDTCLYF